MVGEQSKRKGLDLVSSVVWTGQAFFFLFFFSEKDAHLLGILGNVTIGLVKLDCSISSSHGYSRPSPSMGKRYASPGVFAGACSGVGGRELVAIPSSARLGGGATATRLGCRSVDMARV